MFTPKLNTARSKGVSPFTGSRPAKDRRSIGLFTPPPRTAPTSRLSVGVRSALQTSQIVEETAQHVLESYGSTLPVLVTEALALADRSTVTSVQLDEHGWAWLVCGRRLFVWKYKPSQQVRSALCKELHLPPSELTHCAKLVTLVHYNDHQVACLAASPEGAVRYWPSVAHEGAFVEISTELRGEECVKIITLQSYQCILATSTSSLVLLTPAQGQSHLSFKLCRKPQGMLSGVSRRMSSFLWAAGPPSLADPPLHQVVAGEALEDGSCAFYALTGPNLQKWMVSGTTERFLYEFDVEKQVRENISQAVWGQELSGVPAIKTWIVDMHMARDGLVILAAGMNPDISLTVHYVMGTLHIAGLESPRSFLSFTVTRFTQSMQQVAESAVCSYKLLLPDPSVSSVYLHSDKNIICLSVSTSDIPYDTVEFQNPGDKLLGAGRCDGSALFFSNNHGLVTLKQAESKPTNTSILMNESTANQSMHDSFRQESTLANVEVSQIEEISMSEDRTAQLKAACLYHMKGNKLQAEQILEDLFPDAGPSANLDAVVAELSSDMIDTRPGPDPRWAEAHPSDGPSMSSSLILQYQLEDRLKAYELFVGFISSHHIMQRLTTTTVAGEEFPTRVFLSENAEKVFAAMTLRAHHAENTKLVDAAIRRVLEVRGERVPATGGLTHQDLFYRRVSRVQEILCVLYTMEEEAVAAGEAPRQLTQMIRTVNGIFMGMLHDAWQYRQSKSTVYQGPPNNTDADYTPWTAGSGPKGMRTLLKKQHALTLTHAVPLVQDDQERRLVFQQLLEITDLILEGHKAQVESLRSLHGDSPRYAEQLSLYESDRHALILPFLQNDQPERAASLAEKYCDFSVLVQMCEDSGNYERLQRYMTQFQNRGFADFVFQWYVKQGKRGKLLSGSLANHPQLGKFLQGADNHFMSWMHDISIGDFAKAHETLTELAESEEKSLARRKTLLSLSKLTALATDRSPAEPHMAARLEAINDGLDLVLHQETLPQEVVQVLGLDVNNMHVMKAQEIIEHYVSGYDQHANEYDFKKALDLLQYVPKVDNQQEYEAILLNIWCQAILRDRWGDIQPDDPLENSKDTVFFKTVELAYTEGLNLREYLPSVDRLLEADQLGDLKDNVNFQYLVKAGYEQVERILT